MVSFTPREGEVVATRPSMTVFYDLLKYPGLCNYTSKAVASSRVKLITFFGEGDTTRRQKTIEAVKAQKKL
uniref:Uncharacterized protein n=1 Tax=Utricularia reniformis TaxID=192314 RepID=A0A1Y0B2M0_9LAMI|nr:hypothetical protein AEK19_MT1449 [Utricularia reniformis]ART31641.1 hypothetical protein AEK19_MT1449 [Utricularia reniformis]